ncbi:MAG TPA: ATP-binding cassette domain-containing protein, partial [Clostridia bacterium]|nr:ATP-binding cassette domain-containing protein [Clostridia bacterium]
QVFADFSLQIERGCSTAILGPNGSGKTTFLKLFSRELHPAADSSKTGSENAGENESHESWIKSYGRELWNVWELRQRFGIVSHELQERYLVQTIGREVILSGYHSSVGTSVRQEFSKKQSLQAEEIMDRLEITPLAHRPFGSMSTGEQRRFLLGRALIHDPEVLLLDEPTAGLDLKAAAGYFALLHKLMQQGKTVLLVTHHIHEILPGIERVILLKSGHVLTDGLKQDILSSQWLSRLYDMQIVVHESQGYYYAVPSMDFTPPSD